MTSTTTVKIFVRVLSSEDNLVTSILSGTIYIKIGRNPGFQYMGGECFYAEDNSVVFLQEYTYSGDRDLAYAQTVATKAAEDTVSEMNRVSQQVEFLSVNMR